MRIKELQQELKKIDKFYIPKYEDFCERCLGRSKEARQLRKEWLGKANRIEEEIKSRRRHNKE